MNPLTDPLRTGPEEAAHPASPAAALPSHVGRYRVERLLGAGGFGRVYLAHDDELCRPVAVKVPHSERAAQPGYADSYLAEARILAALDHPHIVPVYDVGQAADGLPFVVSKLIEGCDLAHKIREGRPAFAVSAGLAAAVAEALHHAHRHGLVHRDVKPGNILLDRAGKPYVADFGLALREEDFGKGACRAGTPAYMSPEQARGEGHRVDGRSDVFSLGVVLYELLTGRLPFRAESRDELLDQITTLEPRPPRQIDEDVPKELERICLKALSKRAAERYLTAKDMADDLRHFLAGPDAAAAPAPSAGAAVPLPTTAAATPSDGTPIWIVPRGLRSFEAQDADFFLELLPGPRDREGLPDSVRFWKGRIEETDADSTFAVGLIYGPSGCGKSSLVKAGLLPRLSGHVIAVYVEAAAQETEARLLNGLRKRCPALPVHPGLKETLAALRRGEGLPAGKKVLIVLDQFEQFLHARREEETTELVQALRQCDGGRVQCVVMVRDDFWMTATRFMRDLEIRLVEGQNSAAVDLFPARHAEKVLGAFGRAFGALPEGEITGGQKLFLEEAVRGLAEDGKVVCVRLALFAEMMKGRPWTPAALKEVGGTAGVGVTFLEETFSAAGAPPEHRYHQKAARAVLKALLPQSGGDIKGHMRSHAELLAASGYAGRPRDFDDLLRILDSEVRLITPTDPEEEPRGDKRPACPPEQEPTSEAACGYEPGPWYYQLTHDYLVPSLRDWLTRKQRETRRGRAELRLAERAALWDARPERRLLPAWWEWLNIRLFTRRRDWTGPQRKMMRRATRYHAVRALVAALIFALVGWGVVEGYGTLCAYVLRDRLLNVTTTDVPVIVKDMPGFRRWLDPLLRDAYREAEANRDERKQLHASLALLPADPGQAEYLYGRLLTAKPKEIVVIRDALRPHADTLSGRLWAVLEDQKEDPGRRLRAASALAAYTPDDERWPKVSRDVAARLVAENALEVGWWADALRPVGESLLPPLADSLLREGRSAAERRTLTGIYGDYAAGRPDGFALLEKVLAEKSGPGADQPARLALARRQANAAVALAALGRWEKVWPLLRHTPDPTLRSYLIDRLGPGGAEVRPLTERLGQEPEVSVRRALILALGEFDRDRLPLSERELLVPRLAEMYRDDPDPGMRGAVGWLLRHWGQQEKLQAIDRGLATGEAAGERRWYVNRQGQTMVIVPPPGEFWVREGKERHRRRIDRRFALAARAVTVEEFLRFRKEQQYTKAYAPTADCPMIALSWYDAAAYCNWLSKQEGIPEEQWCYRPNDKGEYAAGMKVVAGYLGRTGYRLPTEAEREHACQAGSETSWSYGETDDLRAKYAWYAGNSLGRSHPVGSRLPNDLGLFDVHGNVWEWCQDRYTPWPPAGGKAIEDKEDIEDISDRNRRVLRGGAFGNYVAVNAHSAHRGDAVPAFHIISVGFRPARTCR